MAALCLDPSLGTLRSLISRHALSPRGSLPLLSRGISSDCPGFCDAFGKPCPPKQSTIYNPGVEVWAPRRPTLGTDKARNVPPQPLLSRFVFCTGTESCRKAHSWPLKKVVLSCFTTPCSTYSWYTRAPVSPLSCKMKMCHLLMGQLPASHYVRRVMASLHTQNAPQGTFGHKSCCSGCYTAPQR